MLKLHWRQTTLLKDRVYFKSLARGDGIGRAAAMDCARLGGNGYFIGSHA